MKSVLILLVNIYQVMISPILVALFGHGCKYSPTCSGYAKESITKFGSVKGLKLSISRLSRCHPFSIGGFDPVPKSI